MREKATFAAGCFWGVEECFSRLPGVTGTRAGYTGGSREKPSYAVMGDHVEAVEVTFDPSVIAYSGLLRHFWKLHDPTLPHKRRYISAIFTHGSRQHAKALESLHEQQKQCKRAVLTQILPASRFYEAEERHQHYYRKMRSLREICR